MIGRGEMRAPDVTDRSRLVRELVRFGAVGGAGVVVNFLAFNVLRHGTALPVVRASVLATVVSIFFNYVGFRYFAYRDREKGRRSREVMLFLLFSAVGLAIENGTLFAATYGFGWDAPLQSNIFKFIGIGIATLFRFFSYRSWVFAAPPDGHGGGRTRSVATGNDGSFAPNTEADHAIRSS